MVSKLAIKIRYICLLFVSATLLSGCDVSPENYDTKATDQTLSVEAVSKANQMPRIFQLGTLSLEIVADDR